MSMLKTGKALSLVHQLALVVVTFFLLDGGQWEGGGSGILQSTVTVASERAVLLGTAVDYLKVIGGLAAGRGEVIE